MEFEFGLPGLQAQDITIWDANALVHLNQIEFHKLRNVLEEFGQRSAAAQGLRAPITDIWRLRSSDCRLYLHTAPAPVSRTTVLGGLKVGRKKLFLHRANGAIVEVEPLCLLDFYVHESCQRQGVGLALFQAMCAAEQLAPEQLGYDRPSPKLLSFLRKHCCLSNYVPQTNHFVVFEQFFVGLQTSRHGGNRQQAARAARACDGASSGGSWRPAEVASLGAGRQNIHVVGSAAALPQDACEPWVASSVRAPTPALQQSVQLQPADSSAGFAASPGAGGGCPTAGVPSNRQSPEGGSVQCAYARGAGYRDLLGPAADRSTYKAFEATLLASASNPAPVATSPSSQQQQGSLRDSLDDFRLSIQAQCGPGQEQGGPANMGLGAAAPAAVGECCNSSRNSTRRPGPEQWRHYQLTSPYRSSDPQPGCLLPPGSEHVSLRRQAQQQLEQRLQQQVVPWQAAGAGPPGHLLSAPSNSYAVPTAAMAPIIGGLQQQSAGDTGWRQQQGQQQQQHLPHSSILSWDGLPPAMQQRLLAKQQQQQWGSANAGRAGQPGQLSSWGDDGGGGAGSRRGSGGLSACDWSNDLGSAKAAAASHRAGSGAASCMRMV